MLAGLVNVPNSIGLGAFAFRPLGPTYVGAGAFAGLASIVLVQGFSILFGANSAAISGIKTAQAFIVATAIGYMISLGLIAPKSSPLETLGIIAFVLLLAGVVQALFAPVGLGALISYVPYPVVAGFQNGAALGLVVSQIGPLHGFGSAVPWFDPYLFPHGVKPLRAAIGLAGIASGLAAFAGALPGTINQNPTNMNFSAGGRTRASGIASVAFVVLLRELAGRPRPAQGDLRPGEISPDLCRIRWDSAPGHAVPAQRNGADFLHERLAPGCNQQPNAISLDTGGGVEFRHRSDAPLQDDGSQSAGCARYTRRDEKDDTNKPSPAVRAAGG